MNVLLQAGADVNKDGKHGTTALIEAAFNGYGDCVQKLLETGVDVNARNAYDNTALIYAAFKGQLNLCDIIIRSRS